MEVTARLNLGGQMRFKRINLYSKATRPQTCVDQDQKLRSNNIDEKSSEGIRDTKV